MFRIGPFAITINGLGAGKKTGRRDYVPETIQLFRQDCISTSFQNGVLIVIVADGHGPEPQGSLISSFASKFIAIAVSLLQPCFWGLALKLGILMMLKSL